MIKRNATSNYQVRSGRKHHGFTLAELIVVLAILAILAAVGVFAVVGYINKSKYEKNQQNAITVYQTAQTALARMTSNGTVHNWLNDIPNYDLVNDSELVFPDETETNYSKHKVLALTYNPNTPDNQEDRILESKYLYSLLSPYFYDPSIFNGTMSVVLDICKTKNNGTYEYTVNVLAVFYSAENEAEGGWDDKCKGKRVEGETLTEMQQWYRDHDLPDSREEYREHTSYVGYCDGKVASSVSSVSLPWDPTYELDGHVIGPTLDETMATGYLFNIRNGETLDISWAIFDEDRDPNREEEAGYNYRYSASDYHEEDLFIVLVDSDQPNNKVGLYIDHAKLQDAIKSDNMSEESYKTQEFIDNTKIDRESWYGQIEVEVKRQGESTSTTMIFPFTKTHVLGDDRTGCPTYCTPEEGNTNTAGYFEYTIALDAMVTRDMESSIGSNAFGINRLFNDSTPRNIYAILVGNGTTEASVEVPITDTSLKADINGCDDEGDPWQTSWNYTTNSGISNKPKTNLIGTYAARAINDPVYFTDINNGYYNYHIRSHSAKNDQIDNTDKYQDYNYIITGRAVVNTYFGDKVYDEQEKAFGEYEYIGGTVWTSSEKEAVLTNCRHLYNIRWMTNTDDTVYKIVSDINWYFHRGNEYYSQVKVFTKNDSGNPVFNSPVESVDNKNTLKIVSFPAFNILPSNATLTSLPVSGSNKYSINNFQLRAGSFDDSTDNAYALICENQGMIYNLYVDSLSLVLENVADGNTCDYIGTNTGISTNEQVTVQKGTNTFSAADRSAGGLVGINNGHIGSTDSQLAESNNTVRVTNSIVMAGNYWKYDTNVLDVGGVIGKNLGSTNGRIEVDGGFVVLGYENVGGIIGYNDADIFAQLVVNGYSSGYSEFSLPELKVIEKRPSCAVLSNCRAGGAIGNFGYDSSEYHEFKYSVKSYKLSAPDESTGEFGFDGVSSNDYHIIVTLPKDALILNVGDSSESDNNSKDRSVGGAIAYLCNSSGNYLNINVNNDGYILSTSPLADAVCCGGAIGRENNCKIISVYLNCENSNESVIGSLNDSTENGSAATGGALGRIDTNTTGLNRTIAVNVVNNGIIRAIGYEDGYGAGGAIGGAENSLVIPIYIKVVNNFNSLIKGNGVANGKGSGTGGAIGGLVNDNNNKSKIVSDTIIFAKNSGKITGHYNVGGAVGNTPIIYGKIFAVDYGSISGDDFVGGTVGRCQRDVKGTIRCTLYGATITGTNFVGGAVGRILNLEPDANVRTVVRSTSTVNGSGYFVGGVCGDVSISEKNTSATFELNGDSSNPILNVNGTASYVGGFAGALRLKYSNNTSALVMPDIVMPTQSDLDRLVIRVEGDSNIGGVAGRIMGNNDYVVDPNYMDKATDKNFDIDIEVKLSPQSHIIGSGNNVGGAVGSILATGGKFYGNIKVISVYETTTKNSKICGSYNVGGAVGSLSQTRLYFTDNSSELYVDFSASSWTIEGKASNRNANVGGVVGYISSKVDQTITNGYYKITSRLGTSSVIASGTQAPNVGGAIGYNYNSLNGTSVDSRLDLGGVISGSSNVGGAIGNNTLAYNNGYNNKGIVDSIKSTINGDVAATGDNVGGTIGYNNANLNYVFVIINGSVNSSGNNVGGAIGYCYSADNTLSVSSVNANVQGSGKVSGNDSVGGAIGCNQCNVKDINATISGNSSSGNSKISGIIRVGGAVGYASATANVTGDNMLKGASAGRITRIKVEISADYALSGTERMGGAVGQVGDKWGAGGSYRSPALISVEATLNSAYLFDPKNTGTDADSYSCIGGIIGVFIDGRLGQTGDNQTGGVILKGSGGVVDFSDFSDYLDSNYYPARVYSNAVFIGAKGSSIGGIIGQIGLGQLIGKEYEQKVCLTNMSVDKDGPDLCVVSINGGNRIGGWIGSGYALHGGFGNDDKNMNATPATYDVKNVKVVISIDENGVGGSEIGGFCGRADGYNQKTNWTAATYGTVANINVDLSDATIIGGSKVGGVFGEAYYMQFKKGKIDVAISSRTNIGDFAKNTLPGDNKDYKPVCYCSGGVIGCVEGRHNTDNKNQFTFSIPITITIDSTSRISGLGSVPSGEDASKYGVGGVFGICDANFNGDSQMIRITSENGTVCAVQSASVNAGGVVGRMVNGTLKNASANISICAYTSNVCVGGVIGRLEKGTINNCHLGPDTGIMGEDSGKTFFINKFGENSVYRPSEYHVEATTNSSVLAGGFAGYVDDATIENCYTTATVNAPQGDAVGGFIGKANKGSVKNSFVGGRTYQTAYASKTGNVTGAIFVGGFVGQTTGAIYFEDCYSTASVLGSGSFVGGFIGARQDSSKEIKNCYCTGLVTATETAIAGVFAGNSNKKNLNGDYVLADINRNKPLVGNLSDDEFSSTTLCLATADTIKGGNAQKNGHPFDGALIGKAYPLRGVGTDNVHWGDWPVAVVKTTNVSDCVVTLGLDPFEFDFDYSKNGYHMDTVLTIKDNDNDYELICDVDYTIDYSKISGVGESTIIVTGIGEYYYGAIEIPVKINPVSLKQITGLRVVIGYPEGVSEEGFEYNGAPKDPKSTVTIVDENDVVITTLVEGNDYYLEYSRDGDVTSNNIDIGELSVNIIGFGNYSEKQEDKLVDVGTFKIIGRNLGDAEVTLINATEEELIYDGKEKEPDVTVRIDGRTLTRNVDYKVEYVCAAYEDDDDPDLKYNHTDVGIVKVVILPMDGNKQFSGKHSKESFEIRKATNLIKTDPTISGWTWGDTPDQPNPLEATFGSPQYSVYTDANCTEANLKVGPCVATENMSAEEVLKLAMRDLDAGSYYLKAEILETANYNSVSKTVPFTVDKANIADKFNVELDCYVYYYDGKECVPNISLVFKNDSNRTLDVSNYDVEPIDDSIHVGTKTITITGKENCYGTTTVTYEIKPTWTVQFDPNGGYFKGEQETTFHIRDGYSVDKPSDPVRDDGYRFVRWLWDPNPSTTEAYVFGSQVKSDQYIYAEWLQTWEVKFYLDIDETELYDKQIVDDKGLATEPAEPTKEGYEFAGWYTDIYYNIAWTGFDTLIKTEYKLYAKWTPEKHKVTYILSDDDSQNIEVLYEYPAAVQEPVVPARESDGYVFEGWYTDVECTEENKFTGFGAPLPRDVILYAKWKEPEQGQG